MGLTMPVKAHLMIFGHGPNEALVILAIFKSNLFAFFILFSICSFQCSLASSWTPRYVTVLEYGNTFPSNFKKSVGILRFLVKSTATVFFWVKN